MLDLVIAEQLAKARRAKEAPALQQLHVGSLEAYVAGINAPLAEASATRGSWTEDELEAYDELSRIEVLRA